MYQDLVVPVTATAGDASALDTGFALAAALPARLSILEMVNLPVSAADPWSLMPDVGMTDLYNRLRAQGAINVAKLQARIAGAGIRGDVRLVEAWFVEPERMVAHYAHGADLVIVPGMVGDTRDGAIANAYCASVLLNAGRPVLVVPPDHAAQGLPDRVVVAWRSTREAARAVHDALPLLSRAQEVDVLVVADDDGRSAESARSGADIAAHLVRHGVRAQVVTADRAGRPVSAVLLDHVRRTRARLLVAGGYGHSRLREWAMGGVTRELMMAASVPVLLSH